MLESLFNKVGGRPLGLQLCQKETPTQLFSCKYFEILRTAFLQNTSGGHFCLQVKEVITNIIQNLTKD